MPTSTRGRLQVLIGLAEDAGAPVELVRPLRAAMEVPPLPEASATSAKVALDGGGTTPIMLISDGNVVLFNLEIRNGYVSAALACLACIVVLILVFRPSCSCRAGYHARCLWIARYVQIASLQKHAVACTSVVALTSQSLVPKFTTTMG